MAFEYKKYYDGEASYKTPAWRKKVEETHGEIGELSFEDMLREQRTMKENEVGLKHPTNGSFIRIKDDGTIEAFTGYGTGIRITNGETMQFFSDQIHMIGRETKINSRPNDSNLNGKQLAGEYPPIYNKGMSLSFLDLVKESEVDTFGLEGTKE